MVEYLPRSAWRARTAHGGPGELTPSRVEGVAVHWPGMGSRRLLERDDVAGALQGWQAYHMDGRGWSDIAYQAAVDQAGRAWTLRGLRTQSGANGSADVNERFGAVLLIVGSGETPSAAMVATTRGVIADFRRIFPRGTLIRPHSAVRPDGTDCPGDAVRELIAAGMFEPGGPTQPPTPRGDWFDMATPKEIEDAMYRGTLRALREYGASLFKDEQGTADALWDEARAHRAAELKELRQIATNTKPAS